MNHAQAAVNRTAWERYALEGTGGPEELSLRTFPLGEGRRLLAALPPGYDEETAGYPVVYLHDGQNLFDSATSFAGSWGLAERLRVRTIVIGIPNRGRRRRRDYSPFRDRRHGGGGGDRYLGFVVGTVKPLVDASFRTLAGREHCVIGGSSLGGLISLYALYAHSDVFGAAAVQSPSLWFAGRAVFRFLAEQAPGVRGRIHLDVGLEEGEQTLRDVRELRDGLVEAGYASGRDLSYYEEAGAGHREEAWGRRLAAALPFLLGGPAPEWSAPPDPASATPES